MKNIEISYEKQMIIMAQSATRLAVDIALTVGKQEDFKYIGNTAHELLKIEAKLASIHMDNIKDVSKTSRKKEITELINSCTNKSEIFAINDKLSLEEQIQYKKMLEKKLKELK